MPSARGTWRQPLRTPGQPSSTSARTTSSTVRRDRLTKSATCPDPLMSTALPSSRGAPRPGHMPSSLRGPHARSLRPPALPRQGWTQLPRLILKLAREQGQLTVVTDEAVGPTYTPDLARQLVALTATNGYGIVHATGVGEVSWHAKETLRLASLSGVPVHEATTTMVRKVRRPTYSIPAHRRLQEVGIMIMRPRQKALAEYVASLTEAEPWEPTDPNQPTGLATPRLRTSRRSPAHHRRPSGSSDHSHAPPCPMK